MVFDSGVSYSPVNNSVSDSVTRQNQRQAFGFFVDLALRQPDILWRFPDGHARLKQNVIGHHGRVAAVCLKHRSEDVIPFVPGKIDINVGRVLATGI
jgi:hypothetical protein